MEALAYEPWQRRAAWGRFLVLLILKSLLLALGGAGGFPFLFLAILPAFYLLSTGLAPMMRLSSRVVLEPEGIRVGGRLYPKERFSGVEGPLGSWTRWEVRPGRLNPYRLRPAWHWGWAPLFYLRFAGEGVPLWLDLPGWDRLLLHLGVPWREQEGLREYLLSARGLAWLNGLLYPPEEVREEWEEARRRYRRVSAWAWAGMGMFLGFPLVVTGLAVLGVELEVLVQLAVILTLLGMLLTTYPFLQAFNIGRGRPGWAVAYSPFGPLQEARASLRK